MRTINGNIRKTDTWRRHVRQRLIPLMEKPVRNRVLQGLRYSWDPATRRFSAECGSRKLYCDLLERITHVRVSWNDNLTVHPLIAPPDPIARAAWTFGFYRGTQA